MKYCNKLLRAAAVVCLLLMIFDSKTVISGAEEGLSLCLATVIPSLFPFLAASVLLRRQLYGLKIPFPRTLRLPPGGEACMLCGFLGGYPLGAQCVGHACTSGELRRCEGERMLAFCSNAGPSFLFGIGAGLFPQQLWLCWIVWGIHILSALIVARLTPGVFDTAISAPGRTPSASPQGMSGAVFSMATVCGWVILFRAVLKFLQRWLLWLLPAHVSLFLCGILELSNGCCSLSNIAQIGLRMQLFSVFLAFGGFCVFLQTHSALQGSGLSGRFYFPGKIAQGAVSYLLCLIFQCFLPAQLRYPPSFPAVPVAVLLIAGYRLYMKKAKNHSSFSLPLGV